MVFISCWYPEHTNLYLYLSNVSSRNIGKNVIRVLGNWWKMLFTRFFSFFVYRCYDRLYYERGFPVWTGTLPLPAQYSGDQSRPPTPTPTPTPPWLFGTAITTLLSDWWEQLLALHNLLLITVVVLSYSPHACMCVCPCVCEGNIYVILYCTLP